ncbi:MAG: HAD family hydrolase [Terracidiphilus sp.]|jgi:phosphoglycolate phosphatase-like HAD superfamily hydrolase
MLTTPPTTEARIYVEPGFAWDGQDAYLFDIDGTLLRNRDRIHRESFVIGVQQVMGVDIEQVLFLTPGGTDPAILNDAFEKAGIARATIEPQWAAILDAIHLACEERRREMDIQIMPGVEAALAHLAQQGALLGVATGNLEIIGWIKIEEAGLREWFRFGGFSDHFPLRAELVADAARKARDLAGIDARVCVVGDTPRDIEAAHANQLPVIAVATGRYSFDALLEGRPEVCASSLADLLAAKRTALG